MSKFITAKFCCLRNIGDAAAMMFFHPFNGFSASKKRK
jgi:hypothetical protein